MFSQCNLLILVRCDKQGSRETTLRGARPACACTRSLALCARNTWVRDCTGAERVSRRLKLRVVTDSARWLRGCGYVNLLFITQVYYYGSVHLHFIYIKAHFIDETAGYVTKMY